MSTEKQVNSAIDAAIKSAAEDRPIQQNAAGLAFHFLAKNGRCEPFNRLYNGLAAVSASHAYGLRFFFLTKIADIFGQDGERELDANGKETGVWTVRPTHFVGFNSKPAKEGEHFYLIPLSEKEVDGKMIKPPAMITRDPNTIPALQRMKKAIVDAGEKALCDIVWLERDSLKTIKGPWTADAITSRTVGFLKSYAKAVADLGMPEYRVVEAINFFSQDFAVRGDKGKTAKAIMEAYTTNRPAPKAGTERPNEVETENESAEMPDIQKQVAEGIEETANA